MKTKDLKRTLEKVGYILSDVRHIPAGLGKNGKEHGEMYLFTMLEHGATETTAIFTTAAFADELQAAIDTLDYLAPITVTGELVGRSAFTATLIEATEL